MKKDPMKSLQDALFAWVESLTEDQACRLADRVNQGWRKHAETARNMTSGPDRMTLGWFAKRAVQFHFANDLEDMFIKPKGKSNE